MVGRTSNSKIAQSMFCSELKAGILPRQIIEDLKCTQGNNRLFNHLKKCHPLQIFSLVSGLPVYLIFLVDSDRALDVSLAFDRVWHGGFFGNSSLMEFQVGF